jgi:hypothetical protein
MPESLIVERHINEEDLERCAWGNVSVAPFQLCKFRKKLSVSLNTDTIKACANFSKDYRWACVFYNNRNERIVSIYLNTNGYCSINGINATYDKKLLFLFRQEYAWLIRSW